MPDAHANFAVSAVATAPSPATSGTSLVVTAGQGTRFPAAPFNATICPASTAPTPANAEIVRVTAVSTDTMTIARAQEGTTARTVIVGDQIFASITAKTLTDAEIPTNYLAPTAAAYETFPRQIGQSQNLLPATGALNLTAIALPSGLSIGHIGYVSATTAATSPTHWWFALFNSSLQLLAVTADQTTTAWASGTTKSLAIANIASGAASSFTTTYTGLHYVGTMMTASQIASLASNLIVSAVDNAPPTLTGQSTTGMTTPPAFPFTASAIIALGSLPYAWVGA